jgi:hypothetical protein
VGVLQATLTDHRADINRLTSDRTKPDNNLTNPTVDTFVFLFSHRTKKIETVYGSRTLLKTNSNVSNFAYPHLAHWQVAPSPPTTQTCQRTKFPDTQHHVKKK